MTTNTETGSITSHKRSSPLRMKKRIEEQRRNRRIRCDRDIAFATSSKHFGFLFVKRPRFYARTKDRSTGGLRMISKHQLQAGECVQLWFDVQSNDQPLTIRLRGTVVASDSDENGNCHSSIRLLQKPVRDMFIWKNDIADSLRRLDG